MLLALLHYRIHIYAYDQLISSKLLIDIFKIITCDWLMVYAQNLIQLHWYSNCCQETTLFSYLAGSGTSVLGNCIELQNHELSLHEINTLEWEELVGSTANNNAPIVSQGLSNVTSGNDHCRVDELKDQEITLVPFKTGNPNPPVADVAVCSENANIYNADVLLTQNSFGSWNCINDDSLGLIDDTQLQPQSLTGDEASPIATSLGDHIFNVTDVSPCWSYCTENTMVRFNYLAFFFLQAPLNVAWAPLGSHFWMSKLLAHNCLIVILFF